MIVSNLPETQLAKNRDGSIAFSNNGDKVYEPTGYPSNSVSIAYSEPIGLESLPVGTKVPASVVKDFVNSHNRTNPDNKVIMDETAPYSIQYNDVSKLDGCARSIIFGTRKPLDSCEVPDITGHLEAIKALNNVVV